MTINGRFDSAYLRRMNCVKTFSTIREQGMVSRSELAAITGLSRATVSETVKELLDRGFIREVGHGDIRRGRPPVNLEVNPERFYLIAVEIDVGWIAVAITTLVGDIVVQHRQEFGRCDYPFVLETCVRWIEHLLDQEGLGREDILGIGVAVPGQVDLDHRVVNFAPNLRWRDAHLADDLEEGLHLPVLVSNEAMLGAMAEKWFGQGKNARVLVYVSVKGGVGCGIVLDRNLSLGVSGSAGELGHMTIDPQGPECSCGNRGCWEVYADEPAILSRAFQAFSSSRDSLLFQSFSMDSNRLTIEAIITEARKGDPTAVGVIQESGWYLGIGITNIVNALNPDLVVVGGRIASSELALEEIRRVVRERGLQIPSQNVTIVPTQLGSKVSLMGCIALLLDLLLEQPEGRINTN